MTHTHDEQMPGAEKSTVGVGRRAIVRGGATAAWVVPAVAIAAPASAAVCSGGSTTLTAVKVGDHQQGGHPHLEVTQHVQVCNTGDSPTCALAATATVSGGSTKLNNFQISGWPGAHSGGDGARSLTVSAPAGDQLAAGDCVTYLVMFRLHDAAVSHNTTIEFFTSNGASAEVTVHTTRQRRHHHHHHG